MLTLMHSQEYPLGCLVVGIHLSFRVIIQLRAVGAGRSDYLASRLKLSVMISTAHICFRLYSFFFFKNFLEMVSFDSDNDPIKHYYYSLFIWWGNWVSDIKWCSPISPLYVELRVYRPKLFSPTCFQSITKARIKAKIKMVSSCLFSSFSLFLCFTLSPHSSVLAWKISWTKEPGRLQSMGFQRVGHDWATSLSLSLNNT